MESEKTYTLEDLEKAKKTYEYWLKCMGDYDGGNPNKYHAEVRASASMVREIEQALKAAGVLEMTEAEKINAELDGFYPNAQSRSIVEYKGKKYQIRYFPLSASRSGKTVHEWGHQWQCLDKEVSPKS